MQFKKIFLAGISLFYVTTIKAEFPTYVLSNFNLNYVYPEGSGTVDEINFPKLKVSEDLRAQDYLLSFRDDQYILQHNGIDYLWEGVPLFAASFEQADIEGLFWVQQGNELNFKFSKFWSVRSETNYDLDFKMNDLEIFCKEDTSMSHLPAFKHLYSSCLRDSTIKFSYTENQKVGGTGRNLMTTLFKSLRKKSRNENEVTWYKDMNARIVNHELNLEVIIQDLGGSRLKVSGETHYLPDQEEFRLRVDSARIGILSVKGRLFENFEEDSGENVRVERPYIYIKVGKKNNGPSIPESF